MKFIAGGISFEPPKWEANASAVVPTWPFAPFQDNMALKKRITATLYWILHVNVENFAGEPRLNTMAPLPQYILYNTKLNRSSNLTFQFSD